jgi:integrase
MSLPHQRRPTYEVLTYLEGLLESADRGSARLDARIASAYFPRKKVLDLGGEPHWCRRTLDGLQFEQIPAYSRNLDAYLPDEEVDGVDTFRTPNTRWRAVRQGVVEVDGASEALARRRLALRLMRMKSNPDLGHAAQLVFRDNHNATEHTEMQEMVISALVRQLDRLSSDKHYSDAGMPDREYFVERPTGIPRWSKRTPQPRPSEIPSLSELIEMWRQEQSPTENSYYLMKRAVRRFIDVNGDMPIDQIRKIHVRELPIRLKDCPRNVPHKLKGEHLDLLIEYGKRHLEIPKYAVTTINSFQCYMRGLLNFAFNRDYVEFNAASGLSLRDWRLQSDKRLPYEISDLKALFETAPLYTGHDKQVRSQPGRYVYRDGLFWFPLIGLFTGARRGEIAGLSPSDLRSENGVYYFDLVKRGIDRRAKSALSERRIPVHDELLRIGIVRYFQRKQKAQEKFVFHDLGSETEQGVNLLAWNGRWVRIQKSANCKHPKKIIPLVSAFIQRRMSRRPHARGCPRQVIGALFRRCQGEPKIRLWRSDTCLG